MRSFFAVAGAVAILLIGPAHARAQEFLGTEEFFATFDQFCVSTGGEEQALLRAASQAGWPRAPDAMIERTRSAQTPVAHIFLRPGQPVSDRDSIHYSAMPARGLTASFCGIQPAGPVDRETLAILVEARLRLPRRLKPDGGYIWMYSGSGPFIDEHDNLLAGQPAALDALSAVASQRPILMLELPSAEEGGPSLFILRVGE